MSCLAQPRSLTLLPPLPAPQVPERKLDAALRLPISGIYKIKGVGDVLAGRVEQGIVKPGDEVIFMPTHTAANKCEGKVRLLGCWVVAGLGGEEQGGCGGCDAACGRQTRLLLSGTAAAGARLAAAAS